MVDIFVILDLVTVYFYTNAQFNIKCLLVNFIYSIFDGELEGTKDNTNLIIKYLQLL